MTLNIRLKTDIIIKYSYLVEFNTYNIHMVHDLVKRAMMNYFEIIKTLFL